MSRPLFVRADAPAKVNLRLEVLGRRDDGFHEVRTWMLAIDLCDRLEARASPSGRVTLSMRGEQASADIPAGEENLVVRAAGSILAEGRRRGMLGKNDGVEIVLEKRIPSRAGLGGGSSDAAAAWIATEAALGITFETGERTASLATLGSDCAFFASARATGFAVCEGRGERVRAAAGPSAAFFVALVVPEVACGTAGVYAALDATLDDRRAIERPGQDPPSDWLAGPARAARRFLSNRLEQAALDAFPSLRPWRELLDGNELAHWRLSGSGSSFFGIYDRREEAEEARAIVLEGARGASLAVRCAWAGPPAGKGVNIVEVR